MNANRFERTATALSDADLREIEGIIGFSLPSTLRQHYLIQNGGTPERRFFVTTDGIEWDVAGFLTMKYPRTPRDLTFERTVVDLVRNKRLMPETLVPFARNSGGDFYTVDRRDGSVAFYTMDHCLDPARAAKRLAGSLKEFVDAMVTEDEAYG